MYISRIFRKFSAKNYFCKKRFWRITCKLIIEQTCKFYRISGYRILSGRIWLFAGYPDNPDPVFFCRIIRIRQCRIIRQLPIQGGKKIKKQHILGGGTFFCTRSVQNYIAQEARENFSRPSGVFRPPPRAKMFLI